MSDDAPASAPAPVTQRGGVARVLGLSVLGLLVVLVAAVLVPLRTVVGQDMAWSLQDGERVWIVPDRVRKADVVLLEDPLQPGRMVLRRVVALPEQKVRIDEGGVRVNGKRIRQTDMGEDGPHRIVKEVIWSRPPARANPYLTQRAELPVAWSSPGVVEVPEGHVYVLADNRDVALDSRWWGPVPDSAIQGVVRARWGTADTWRESWQLLLPEE